MPIGSTGNDGSMAPLGRREARAKRTASLRLCRIIAQTVDVESQLNHAEMCGQIHNVVAFLVVVRGGPGGRV